MQTYHIVYCCPNHNFVKDVVECIDKNSALKTLETIRKNDKVKCKICDEKVIYYLAERHKYDYEFN